MSAETTAKATCVEPRSSSNRRVVVVAVDASEHSQVAFGWFMSEIYRKDDFIVLCHVPEVPSLPFLSLKHGLGPPVDEWQKLIQKQLEKVQQLENNYEAMFEAKVMHKFVVEQTNKPGEGIIRVAENENAKMIVMGTRGLDRLRRSFLGSVSDYVVRHSNLPVLICPPSCNGLPQGQGPTK